MNEMIPQDPLKISGNQMKQCKHQNEVYQERTEKYIVNIQAIWFK